MAITVKPCAYTMPDFTSGMFVKFSTSRDVYNTYTVYLNLETGEAYSVVNPNSADMNTEQESDLIDLQDYLGSPVGTTTFYCNVPLNTEFPNRNGRIYSADCLITGGGLP